MSYRNDRKSLYHAEIDFRDNENCRTIQLCQTIFGFTPSLPPFLGCPFSLSLSDSINSNTPGRRDALLSEMASSIHVRNKLNDPLHAQQIVRRAIQPSLILIRSRKVGKVVTTTLRMTRVARRGATKLSVSWRSHSWIMNHIYYRSYSAVPRKLGDGDIPIPNSILRPPTLPFRYSERKNSQC